MRVINSKRIFLKILKFNTIYVILLIFTILAGNLLILNINAVKAQSPSTTPPNTQWSQTYGGIASDSAFCVIQTSDGGYALSGETNSYGNGGWDFWLVKTDSSGNLQWSQTYGGVKDERCKSLVETSDGGFALAGSTESYGAGSIDGWLVKVDASGTVQWTKTYGGTRRDHIYCVVQTSDGGYALAGTSESFGSGFYPPGFYDFWLIKTDNAGNMEWNQTCGSPNRNEVANCVVQTSDGGYALAGFMGNSGGTDLALIKTDSAGNTQWTKPYGFDGPDEACCVVQTSDGGYAIAGYIEIPTYGSSRNLYLVKTDDAGNTEWTQTLGGTGSEGAWCVVQTSDGGYALAGNTSSYGSDKSDFWLIKTDSSGNPQWNQTYGGPNDDSALYLVQTSDKGYAIAGYTSSYGGGSFDFWLIKVAGPVGAVLEFPSWVVVPLTMVIVLSAVFATKKKKKKN